MRIRWRGLELPSQVIRDDQISTDTYGRFMIEPFERGFGTTIGNSLRRILLSSLEGAAVTRVKIAGADHEFTTLPGVVEDVTDIILNIKSLVVRLDSDEPKSMRIRANKAGNLTARAIEADPAITIANIDQHIATLTTDAKFDIEMTVERGRGYRTADENEGLEQVLGVIPIDSIFSPVTRVRYKTQETRVGQRVNYDRLIIEIWTKGTLLPENALVEAAKILRKHLNPFVQYHEPGDTYTAGEPIENITVDPSGDPELETKLAMSVGDLELSVRANNCLASANVNTVAELVRLTESDLLNVRSFGKTSLREIKRKLADLGLSLGLRLPAPSRTGETAEVSH
jgi:DNA-directed RNA polymerase subunit alpha